MTEQANGIDRWKRLATGWDGMGWGAATWCRKWGWSEVYVNSERNCFGLHFRVCFLYLLLCLAVLVLGLLLG